MQNEEDEGKNEKRTLGDEAKYAMTSHVAGG